jgi:hypothetical protein
MKKKTRWIWGGFLFLLAIGVALLFVFRESILVGAGNYMAPRGAGTADVAILEGSEFLQRDIVKTGMELLASGRVRRLVVVLHNIAPSHRPFAFNENYTNLVGKELQGLGLKEGEFRIIVASIRNPVTLIAAQRALEMLSRENVKSAILLSPGFHTRRSFLAYQHAGNPYQMKIIPYACFGSYQLDRWWDQDTGLRDFAAETLKLFYYFVRGYIPLTLSCESSQKEL